MDLRVKADNICIITWPEGFAALTETMSDGCKDNANSIQSARDSFQVFVMMSDWFLDVGVQFPPFVNILRCQWGSVDFTFLSDGFCDVSWFWCHYIKLRVPLIFLCCNYGYSFG